MLKFLELKGKNVYFENNSIGTIENAIMHYRLKRLTSILIKPVNEKGIIYLSKTNNIKVENDFVYIIKAPFKVNINHIKKVEDNFVTNLISKSVFDKDKREIGSIVDIILDEDTGNIKALIVSMGFYDDIITGRKLVIVKEEDSLESERAYVNGNQIEMINQISTRLF